jgi:hypothetical protein
MSDQWENDAKFEKTKEKAALKPTRNHDLEYHVVWNENRKCWDIEVDGQLNGAFSYDRSTAIGNAIRDATRDKTGGLDVIVCSQNADGSFELEWPI